jgi:3'-phosphoadenosine 5'-phosphosulfate sulfotransferase (PAPS reductase)/FAD synthetase/ferredoxin
VYKYTWDEETGGLLLLPEISRFSNEPRPVYYKELDALGFDKFWNYPKDDKLPLMWAEANNYIYKGQIVAKTKGGALYTSPEIILLDKPEPDGIELKFVDIDRMIEKNRIIMEELVQETIQKVYNTYKKYKNKVDVFYVAFSGGKDSVVALDIVQRALPHDDFIVLFADTQMEFIDTYNVVNQIEFWCQINCIQFFTVKSQYNPNYTWNLIGPPAQKMRWCCGVHKTVPQILFLRTLTNKLNFRGMALMGVRSDESVTRGRYNELNYSTKHKGQYDFYPIFNWSSAELFIYIFQNKLIINETYKSGNSRAGCLVCPMEASKNTWFKEQLYKGRAHDCRTTTFFNKIIIEQTVASNLDQEHLKEFMNIGVWKSRHNGSKLLTQHSIFHEEKIDNNVMITLDYISVDWREWLKTIGQLNFLSNNIVKIFIDSNCYILEYDYANQKHIFTVRNIGHTQKDIYFISWLKIILKKSAYCIKCQICEANCPNGYIHMSGNKFYIDDKCTKCKQCYDVNGGCVVAASQYIPKGVNKMNGSIDQYKNMGIRYSWVVEYLEKGDDFWSDNNLGSEMQKSLKRFLGHAGISEKNTITIFGKVIFSLKHNSTIIWALMLCNLVYTSQFNWWVMNIQQNRIYLQEELNEMLKDTLTDNQRKNVLSGFKNIFFTNNILSQEIGFGIVTVLEKERNSFLVDAKRKPWDNPDPRVILYSLYKFAEACGDYYQFSLSTLLDDTIERDGVSPTRIFGLNRETMVPILNGLAVNYPEFISASFSLGLETIDLYADKTAQDVLTLF